MNETVTVDGGSVTTPRGFMAAGVAAGIKESGDRDVALLVSTRPAHAAGAFTANAFAAPAVQYDRALLKVRKPFRAVLVNSGNANACTGAAGLADAKAAGAAAARVLGVSAADVLVASTGRIGVRLPMARLRAGIAAAAAALSADGGPAAARAIMTTDTRPKSTAASVEVDGKTIHIGGMTKGAGMIAPRLQPAGLHATMLAFVTTDAAVEPDFLDACLAQSLDLSFNRITVDGDMSTNDTFLALANGAAENTRIRAGTPAAAAFAAAFNRVAATLAREMVLDGEGATRFVEICVTGAQTWDEARRCAEAIANSALCKTAWFGADPNWGRIVCAAGRAKVALDPDRVSLDFGGVPIVRAGVDAGTPETEKVAAVSGAEFRIALDLGVGSHEFTVWTCDLSYDYVRINAEYHT